MAYSFATYTGDGSTVDFVVPFPYLLQSHISATVGLSVLVLNLDYTFVSGGTILRFTIAPAAAATVVIRRNTSQTQRITSYVDGAALTKEQLDTDARQNFYMAQEAYDHVEDVAFGAAGSPLNILALSTGASLVGGGDQIVDNLAGLRALLKTSPSKYATTLGGVTRGDGLSSTYYYDSTDLSSVDNGGSIIVANDGGRWKKALSAEGTSALDVTTKNITAISEGGLTYNAGSDNQLAIAIANIGKRKNRIINGNFNVWQRDTTQSTSGYGSDDRWVNLHQGNTTKIHSQQAFALGQSTVPGNPKWFSRTVVTAGAANATNICFKEQRIEDVETLHNTPVTLSFYAKADVSCNISLSLIQFFGTGGSPSATVSTLIAKQAITTGFVRYTLTFTPPSVSGKTLGSGKDDYLAIRFYFSAGTAFNTITDTLGEQSRTIDISNVQLEPGNQATDFEYRPIQDELQLCYRYFEWNNDLNADFVISSIVWGNFNYKATKRKVPTATFIMDTGGVTSPVIGKSSCIVQGNGAASGGSVQLDAELL